MKLCVIEMNGNNNLWGESNQRDKLKDNSNETKHKNKSIYQANLTSLVVSSGVL